MSTFPPIPTDKPYRKFSYQGAAKTRFGFYGPSPTPGHVMRHEFSTRRERNAAFKKAAKGS